MADNTVFDSVFKTMVHKMPQLMIPFINEVFGRGYAEDERVVPFNDEHQTPRGTKIDDAVFRLGDKFYHVECQTTDDKNMVIRMVEYDFNIALERALSEGEPYRMEFPSSCVLLLRHTDNTPDVLTMEVMLPDGGSFEYHVRVVKAQLVGEDEIFRKRLLLLLPYYLMRYEQVLPQIAADDDRTALLIAECLELRMRLAEATLAQGDTRLYEELVELIIRVSDHITESFEALRKKVRAAMGGEVLELWADRAQRLEREAQEARERGLAQGLAQGLEQGREQGLEQGLEQGREQGLEQGVSELSEELRGLGVDEAVLAQAVALLRAKHESEDAS